MRFLTEVSQAGLVKGIKYNKRIRSSEGQQLEGLIVDHIASWVLPDRPCAFRIKIELPNHKVDHLLHPCSPESFKTVQQCTLSEASAPTDALLPLDVVSDDLAIHLRAVIVVLRQGLVGGRGGEGEIEEGEEKEEG